MKVTAIAALITAIAVLLGLFMAVTDLKKPFLEPLD
jgi:hypothetical protein